MLRERIKGGIQMKVLAKTANLTKQEWLKLRTKGIGGSDVSIIAGINSYKSIFQLWMEKTGMMEPEEVESDYAHFGTVLEPIVRNEFMQRTGIKVRLKNCIMQHEEYPYMICNLDGVIYENGEMNLFEAKTASAYKLKEWEEGVPPEYQLQIQHYMAITGAKKTYIAALIGGNQFIYHIVERDEELIHLIIQMEKLFWEEHVKKNVPPEIDGSTATSKYLEQKYKNSIDNLIQLPQSAEQLLGEFDLISEEIKTLTEKKNQITNSLKELLGENEKGIVNERMVKWSSITKDTFDSKKLKQEMHDIYERYLTQSSYRRFTVA